MESIDTHEPSAGKKLAVESIDRTLISRPGVRLLLLLAALGLLILLSENDFLGSRFQTFVTIFLSIFIEAAPFLLAGAIVSGFLAVFVDNEMIYRFVPRHPIAAALFGGSLGLFFPVCECGVVPVTRRLYQKNLPIATGIAFLLAAPVINPIVIASTYAAFGWGPILYGRLILSFVIAAGIGLLFYLATPGEVIRSDTVVGQISHTAVVHAFSEKHDDSHHHHHHQHASPGLIAKIREALVISGDDFFDMGRYLVVGSLLAAGMQTLVSQQALLDLGSGTVTSILVMMVLAFVLSVCSTVDAFLALAFANIFPPAAILAFLVFGPMVDIKSSLMFLGIFKRRIVLYLILLPFMATLMITAFINLNMG
ncbi:MAG: permease [Anaerolineales bacterium]|nr:permease [Anaerolineales bacterium]